MFKNIDFEKNTAISLFVVTFFSNGIGAIIALNGKNITFWSRLNTFITCLSFIIVVVSSVIFFIKKKYNYFSLFLVTVSAFLTFPMMIITSPDAVFMPFIPILAPVFGFLAYMNSIKSLILGIIAIIICAIAFEIKVHFNINLRSDYIAKNFTRLKVAYISNYLFCLIIMYRAITLLTKANEKLSFNASHDSLTKCYNRQALNEFLKKEKLQFGCIIDIDFFKKINDTFGHKEGDKALQLLTSIIEQYTSDTFKLFRYGGEEFFIGSRMDYNEFIATLKGVWIALSWQFELQKTPLTVSIGVADGDNKSNELLLEEADKNLYKAKNAGRNQTWYKNKKIF